MLTFHYTAKLTTMLPCDPSTSKPLEPFTGIIEAENYDAAKQKAWTPIIARKKQIEAERGIMVGVGNVEVVCQTVSTPDGWTEASARTTFLNRLKHQIREVTKALDASEQVFGQSLEATAVKHAVTILLSELAVHGLSPEAPVMTPLAYQQCALRTLYPDLTTDKRLGLCGLGLPGEVGEVVDLIKKFLYHRNGKPLDVEKLKDELGDMLWYFAVLLDTIGLTFEDVMMANVAKLEARHGNGFNPHYASDSHASEVER